MGTISEVQQLQCFAGNEFITLVDLYRAEKKLYSAGHQMCNYQNTQYAAFFFLCGKRLFSIKICDIFLLLFETLIVGTHNLCLWIKNMKKCIPLLTPVLK